MPPNEQCSQWWLELDVHVALRLWVNGQLHPEDAPLNITPLVAMGQNALVMHVSATSEAPRVLKQAACVPYPC